MSTRAVGLTIGLSLLALGSPLSGQTAPPAHPKRPKLSADRDTNSAASYFSYGASVIDRSPELAGDAFYWASRLDPAWADPWYGRYVALLLSLPQRMLTSYFERTPKTLRDPEILAIDSLASVAQGRNPYVDRRFDATLLETWLRRETNGAVSTFDLNRSDPEIGAWLAYGRGDYHEALRLYGLAQSRYGTYATFHLDRALPFVSLGLTDSALTEMRIDQRDSARAAYERALVDDVRFFPAHRGLGLLRLASGDTAGAIGEYSQAVELAPSDALPSYELGLLWIAAGHPDSAVARLERASKAEPFYPAPHYPLGLLYERSGFLEEAAEHYTIYLRLAPQLLKGQAAIVRRRLDAHQVTSKAP